MRFTRRHDPVLPGRPRDARSFWAFDSSAHRRHCMKCLSAHRRARRSGTSLSTSRRSDPNGKRGLHRRGSHSLHSLSRAVLIPP